ncbi:hypothetical protein D3C73_1146130 [compost metagenome]
MVGDHDHVGGFGQAVLLQAIEHLADDPVGLHDRIGVLPGFRPKVVAGLVHMFHVQRGQAWRIGICLRQPVEHCLRALFKGFLGVVYAPLAGPCALDLGFAARP